MGPCKTANSLKGEGYYNYIANKILSSLWMNEKGMALLIVYDMSAAYYKHNDANDRKWLLTFSSFSSKEDQYMAFEHYGRKPYIV